MLGAAGIASAAASVASVCRCCSIACGAAVVGLLAAVASSGESTSACATRTAAAPAAAARCRQSGASALSWWLAGSRCQVPGTERCGGGSGGAPSASFCRAALRQCVTSEMLHLVRRRGCKVELRQRSAGGGSVRADRVVIWLGCRQCSNTCKALSPRSTRTDARLEQRTPHLLSLLWDALHSKHGEQLAYRQC